MKRLVCMLCAVLLMIPLWSCERNEQSGSGAGHSFAGVLTGNPDTLDPQLAVNGSAGTVLHNLFEGLFVIGEKGAVENGVAESYTVSEDGLTYTIQLRQDSYWYAATENESITALLEAPVNAMDFVYAFRRLFDPLYQSPHREQFRCIAYAEEIINGQQDPSMIGVYAKKEYELEIRLAQPNADLPYLLAQTPAMPCRQSYFESCKGRYGLDEASICGNGSFAMQRWLYDPYGKHNVIRLVRNRKNHEVQRVYPADLTLYIENSVSAAEQLYSAGSIDVLMTANGELAAGAKGTVQGVYSRTLGLVANPDSPYANKLIRQAFACTVDLAALDDLPQGLQAAYGVLPPDVLLANKSCRELIAESRYRTTDRTQAQEDLVQGMAALGIEELPEGRIIVPAGWVDDDVMLQLMEQWKSTLGVYLSLEEVSEEDYASRLKKGDYTLAIAALQGSRNDPDGLFRAYLQHPAMDFADSAQEIVRLYTLLEQAKSADSPDKQVELYRSAEQQVLQDSVFLPLFYGQQYLLCGENIADVQWDPFGGVTVFSQAKCFD